MDGELGIIGAGRMGAALLAGLLESGVCRPEQVHLVDVDADRVAALVDRHGVSGGSDADASEAALARDVVVLALKPQVLPAVLAASGHHVRDDALVVSIAAGVTGERIDGLLSGSPAIVRVMPNTPALVRQGASVVSAGPRASRGDIDVVSNLMGALGRVLVLPESSLDAVTAVSGSGPAYVFLLVEAMAEAGVLNGLSRDDAVVLATQTVVGAGALLAADLGTATELREQVTSPGGTTAAALQVLERAGLRAAVLDAVTAATERARSLS